MDIGQGVIVVAGVVVSKGVLSPLVIGPQGAAWNEWGEGAYLKLDNDTKYLYLEVVKKVIDDENNKKYNKTMDDK